MKDSDKSKQQLMIEVNQLRRRVETLEEVKKTFDSILDRAPILISVKDLAGNVTLANRRFNVLEHLSYEEFVGHNIYELFPYEVADALWKDDLRALAGNTPVETEETLVHTDQTKHIYYTVKFPISTSSGEIFGLCSLSYDISEIKQSLELSINDKLTGLYSRHYFHMCFQSELYRAGTTQNLFAMVLIDIDNFDVFQNEYGDQRTDDVILTIAVSLQNICSRSNDLCFRLKDHRLACLLLISDEKDIEFITEEIRSYIESLSIEHPGNPPLGTVTVSVGYSVSHWQDKLNQEQICNIAKTALFKAKSQGGNRISTAYV